MFILLLQNKYVKKYSQYQYQPCFDVKYHETLDLHLHGVLPEEPHLQMKLDFLEPHSKTVSEQNSDSWDRFGTSNLQNEPTQQCTKRISNQQNNIYKTRK